MKVNLKIVAGVGAALLLAGNASAAVLTATSKDYSKEGYTATTGNERMPTITAILAADYKADDRIALTISGGAAVAGTTDLTAKMSCNAGITVGFLNRDGNTINFRVTQILEVNNLGATCTIEGIDVTKASLGTATTVVGTYAAKTIQGEVIDTGCATAGTGDNPFLPGTLYNCSDPNGDGSTADAKTPNRVTLATVQSQFSAAPTKDEDVYDGVIDVEQDRKAFEDGTHDDLDITITDKVGLIGAVDVTSYKYKVVGNFSPFAGPDGKCGTSDDVGGAYSDYGTVVMASDCASFTVTYATSLFAAPAEGANAAVRDDRIHIDFDGGVDGDVGKLSPQQFSSTFTFGWPTDKTSAFNFSAGAWTINGALVFVPYMPYGDNISQIIYIANRGSQVGEISVDAFDETGASYSFDVGTVSSGTVRKLTQEIIDGLTTAGFKSPGKVAFEITVTAPADDIDVYSAYNVGGSDRGTVVNSQNGRAKTCDNDCYYWD